MEAVYQLRRRFGKSWIQSTLDIEDAEEIEELLEGTEHPREHLPEPEARPGHHQPAALHRAACPGRRRETHPRLSRPRHQRRAGVRPLHAISPPISWWPTCSPAASMTSTRSGRKRRMAEDTAAAQPPGHHHRGSAQIPQPGGRRPDHLRHHRPRDAQVQRHPAGHRPAPQRHR